VINPKHILFNLDNCRHDYVIITEGVFDCIRLAGDYCTNVAATMGISTSEEQVRLLADRFKTVYICFDPEIVAQDRARKLGAKLSMLGVNVKVIDTEKPYDLGDTSWNEAMNLKHDILQGELF
jgi:DNA primase